MLLTARGSAARALSCSGVRLGFLSADGQAHTMTSATVAAKIREALNIHGDFSSSITFDNIFGLYNLSNTGNIISAQVITVHRVWKINGIENLPRRGYPNPMDIGKRSIHMLVFRKVNPCYTCQDASPLVC